LCCAILFPDPPLIRFYLMELVCIVFSYRQVVNIYE
jgi:hypothetical protein